MNIYAELTDFENEEKSHLAVSPGTDSGSRYFDPRDAGVFHDTHAGTGRSADPFGSNKYDHRGVQRLDEDHCNDEHRCQ